MEKNEQGRDLGDLNASATHSRLENRPAARMVPMAAASLPVFSFSPTPLKAPEKELRFTRSRQAVPFWLLGLLLAFASLGLWVMWWQNLSLLPPWWLALIPLAGAAGAIWMALRLTRHAYLLLSPVGVEIFPFFKPTENYQLVTWGSIAAAEVSADDRWLTLTLAGYEDVKIILTLDPVDPRARQLLVRAVTGVMERREEMTARAAGSQDVFQG